MKTKENMGSQTIEMTGTFGPVVALLSQKQKPFLATLARVGNGYGWDDGVFTGGQLCAVATYALYDGLKKILDPSFTPIARGMHIFMNKVYRPESVGFPKDAYGFHSILEIAHPQSPSLFVDAAHGQLNKSWVGKFLTFNAEHLGEHYSVSKETGLHWQYAPWRPGKRHSITTEDLLDITPQKDVQVQYFEKSLGIPKSGYEQLVASLGDNV